MPNEYWLQRKFIYYYFIDKGITPKQVDEMDFDDVQIVLLINRYSSEKQDLERKREKNKLSTSIRR